MCVKALLILYNNVRRLILYLREKKQTQGGNDKTKDKGGDNKQSVCAIISEISRETISFNKALQ